MNPHHIEITSLQLTDITKLLHHIPLCVNREVGEPRSLRPRAQAIGGDPQDLAPPHKHCNMKADQICLAHPHRVRIIEKLLHQGIVVCANGSGHFVGGKGGVYFMTRQVNFQFYAPCVCADNSNFLDQSSWALNYHQNAYQMLNNSPDV